ncbi:arsinothricin resistance N-acetyltransferase ArsN1 family A [Gemmatimonas sp.]
METQQRPAFPATVGSAPANLAIRAAAPADAQAIASIYNEGIRGRTATFETAERTPEDILAWFTLTGAAAVPYPFLVAEIGDSVVGWVRASSYRPRDAYRQIAEYSVYVATAAQGQRVGDTLLAAFLPVCEVAGISKLVSRIFPENGASLALCARHGFRVVGTYERHAALDGVWRDVVIVERLFPTNLR